MKPQIISAYDGGAHNADLHQTNARLTKEKAWKDLSCVLIVPAIKDIPPRIVANWWNLMQPPNQKVAKLFAQGMEVGEAYSSTIEAILANPELSKFRFVVTLEHDNAPPPDGLVRILACADSHPEFAAIGGLYFTKGHGGVAQIWGDPNEHPVNYRPQMPDPQGGLKECCGTGMGFTCFRMELFKDPKLRRPWFKTTASQQEGASTQDLFFASDARKHGYRFAVDCSIRVGHWDSQGEIMW
jgi:hypothetical protein